MGIPFETPEPSGVAAFQAIVKLVYAACGQLKRMDLVEIRQ
jgi:hypothetical protein